MTRRTLRPDQQEQLTRRTEELDVMIDESTQDGEYITSCRVQICSECGALVLHQGTHSAWHERLAGGA